MTMREAMVESPIGRIRLADVLTGLIAQRLIPRKDEKGRVRVKLGMPRLSQLPAITGLPAQKIDDPELREFR